MAELIDKSAIFPNGVFLVDENNPMASVGELINRISNLPTVTEAEIRAKAIEEFAERLGILCENSVMALDRYNTRPLYNKGGKWNDLINDVAEQLKGE